jgi:putative addiction module component (TIGR02574 family)
MTIADIISSAQQLPLAQQYKIAEALLDSIDPMPREIAQAWQEESQDRVSAFDAGQMPTGSLEAVLTKYRA